MPSRKETSKQLQSGHDFHITAGTRQRSLAAAGAPARIVDPSSKSHLAASGRQEVSDACSEILTEESPLEALKREKREAKQADKPRYQARCEDREENAALLGIFELDSDARDEDD